MSIRRKSIVKYRTRKDFDPSTPLFIQCENELIEKGYLIVPNMMEFYEISGAEAIMIMDMLMLKYADIRKLDNQTICLRGSTARVEPKPKRKQPNRKKNYNIKYRPYTHAIVKGWGRV